MNQLKQLKSLVQILFALSIILMFFLVPFILISIVMPESIPFKIDGEMAKDVSTISKLVLFIALGGIVLFIYALYIFKQNIVLFEKRKVFHEDVIANFRKMGRFIYWGVVLTTIGTVAFRMTRGAVSIDLGEIMQIIFIASLGLFFQVLGGVFQLAKTIKEENDLTV